MVPFCGRYGNQRSVGESVGVFQLIERDNMWVIFTKMIPNVDIDLHYVHGTRGEGQHDNHREQNGQPSPTHDVRYAGFQIHINLPTYAKASGMASPVHLATSC